MASKEIPISLSRQYRYATGAWTDEESAVNGYTGSYTSSTDKKTYENRVVIPITIPTNIKNKELSVTLSFIKQNMSELTAFCTLTNAGKGEGYSTQGTIISEDSKVIKVTSSGTSVTFTLYPGEYEGTLYLWINTSFWATLSSTRSATLYYDESYGNPTSPTITTSNQFYTLDDTLTVKWSGGSGGTGGISISSYTLKIRKKTDTGTVIHTITGISSYIQEKDIAISDFDVTPERGDILYATIQAIGNVYGYDGEENSGKVGKINQLPNAPTHTASGTNLNETNYIKYNLTYDRKDDDGQTLTPYYSLDGGKNKYKISSSSLTITTNTDGVESGNNTIVFYTHDTIEFSSPSSPHTFTATFKPVIEDIVTKYNELSDSNLASAAEIQITMSSGNPNSAKLYVRTGNSTALSGNGSQVASGFSYNDQTNTIIIKNLSDISNIEPGSYFQFAVKVNDGITDSDLKGWSAVKRKPYIPILPTFDNYDRFVDEIYKENAKEGYCKNRLQIYYTNNSFGSGYAKITSLEIIAEFDNSNESFSCPLDKKSVELTLDKVNANAKMKFKFRVTDEANQTVTSDEEFLTLIKASDFVFVGKEVQLNINNLKPLTNEQPFQINHPYANSSGTKTVVYKYYISLRDKELWITPNEVIYDEEEQLIKAIFNTETIKDIAERLVPNQNEAFKDTKIIVYAYDGFGEEKATTEVVFTINYTEPPYFINESVAFKILHDFYTDTNGFSLERCVEINGEQSSENLYNRMINSGEGIVFALPKAEDPNEDIKEYQIFLARSDFTGDVPNINSANFSQHLISIPYNEDLKKMSDDNYYYYRYTASTYTKNEAFFFKTRVADDTGNFSKELICENYLIGCRTVSPTFSSGNVKVVKNTEGENCNLTLIYNFKILDLGGSAKSSGWELNYYKKYPNFERKILGYEPKAKLEISISPNQTFDEENDTIFTAPPIEYIPSGENGLINFTSKSITFYSENFAENLESFKEFVKSDAKIFMRFRLYLSYTLQDSDSLAYISSVPQIYTYFGSVPTIAHRIHKVGINTTALDQDDVLVVENYQGTKYVRFKGTSATDASKTYEIVFDLLTGSIDGAVIDCGSW